ncbi:hypothetical protein K9L97_01535 [Candidatus Woesearchaeota archaeon]|nr:hypothetical protein [Candidatus Woesearchaeota archaeon]
MKLRNKPGQGRTTITRQELSDKIPSNYKLGPHGRKNSLSHRKKETAIYLASTYSYASILETYLQKELEINLKTAYSNEDLKDFTEQEKYSFVIIEPQVNKEKSKIQELTDITEKLILKTPIIIHGEFDENLLKRKYNLKSGKNYNTIQKPSQNLSKELREKLNQYIK